MGAEDIVRAICDETAQEVDSVLSDARREARRILADARRSARQRIATALAQVDPELAAESARKVNAVRLELLHSRAQLSAERLDAVFAEAERRLCTIAAAGGPRWHRALTRLAGEGIEACGAGSTAWVRPADLTLPGCQQSTMNALGNVCADEDQLPGVVTRSADGRVEVDATLPVRLARSRVILAERLASVLGASAS